MDDLWVAGYRIKNQTSTHVLDDDVISSLMQLIDSFDICKKCGVKGEFSSLLPKGFSAIIDFRTHEVYVTAK